MCHCCLLERTLRASLEWREVANLLATEGLWPGEGARAGDAGTRSDGREAAVDARACDGPGARSRGRDDAGAGDEAGSTGTRVWALAARHLRRDAAFARRCVHLVSELHARWLRAVSRLPLEDLVRLAGSARPLPAGLVWALVCDARPAVVRLGTLTAARVLARPRA